MTAKSNYPHLREAQRIVWRKDCTLSSGARHVAAYLLNRMNENYDGAFPSVARIGDDLGMSKDTVIRHTQEVVEDGFLSRKAGRKGMYTYRITSMEDLVAKLDTTLEEWAREHWATKQLNGQKLPPVAKSDRSEIQTATGQKFRPQPVAKSDPERLSLKAQVKGQYSPPPRAADSNPSSPQVGMADTSDSESHKVGSELQLHEPEVVVPDEGIPWVETKNLPAGYAQGVFFNRCLGKLYLVQGELGLAFYRSLRDDGFSPAAIRAGLTAAGAKAAGVANGPKARGGALQGLVRQYVGYAQEKELQAVARTSGQPGAFQGRPRMFVP
jgi:hypothetical protein